VSAAIDDLLRAAASDRRVIAAGVVFDPGSTFRPDRAARPFAVRRCFSAAPVAAFDEAARRLAMVWRRAAAADRAQPRRSNRR
jgi:DNA-binding transcriptional MocR family regulator